MKQDNIDSIADDEQAIQMDAKGLAMTRICAGMTMEEMQNAPFTYQSLLEIVQRRDVRNVCVPDAKDDSELGKYDNWGSGYCSGWNDCREEMISRMGEQK